MTQQTKQTKQWEQMTDAEKAATAKVVVEGMKGVLAEHPDMSLRTKKRMLGGLADVHQAKGQPEVSAALRKLLESEGVK